MTLSIVICSKQNTLSDGIKNNLLSTSGISDEEQELIVIDNSNNDFSIFQAYNKGVTLSHGEIMCFIHEDVVMHTLGWGKKLLEQFSDSDVGLVGMAGTHFLPKTKSTWFDPEMRSDNFIQGSQRKGHYYSFPVCHDKYKKISNELVCVDGMFLCIRASLFDRIIWDTETFNGFHCYDMDICLQVLKAGYKVCMNWDILIEHKSPGCFNSVFYDSLEKFYNKWIDFLPEFRGVTMSEGEVEARTKMVKLKREIQRIKWSREYLLGLKLLRIPKKVQGLISK